MAPAVTFDVVVLAGGRSRRMGRDKATLRYQGQRLVDRAVSRFDAVAGRVIVARGDRPLGCADEVDDHHEDLPDLTGPLAGVLAGMEAATSPLVALVPVDAPNTSPALVEALVARCREDAAPVVVPVAHGHVQVLHAVIDRQVLPAMRARARAGEQSLRRILGHLDASRVTAEGWWELDPTGAFARDWDTPEDLPEGV